jgi:preprotein translocase subunit SecA
MTILNKFFGDPNEKYLKSIQPLIEKINGLEEKFESFSSDQLKEKTKELKQRINKEGLDGVLPEAFALVREAGKRTLKQRHFDCQLIGGIALHQGNAIEMKTGEGKTLAATLPVFLNALISKGVHVVTVNDYLARRDIVWMGQIYDLLGLSVACLNHQQSFLYDPDFKKAEEEKDEVRDELGSFKIIEDFLRPCSRKEAYAADITYGTNNEFGFDYLRDNMAYGEEQKVQRGFNYVIVDEIDSILIDEARTPLIISAPDMESSEWYRDFARIAPRLDNKSDYEIDEKLRTVSLTEQGISRVENILGVENIYEDKGIKYLHYLEQALRAQAINPSDGKPLFAKDRDYVVRNGEIIIVDEFTGRLMPGRRWSGGLHQAIEAKEGVKVNPESKTLASITFQNYFRMYEKISGMTGTAADSAEEFDKVYKLNVIVIPTNLPMVREDLPDRIFKTEKGKLEAVIKEIKERNQKGQPILVGTRSVDRNEYLGKLLDREGIRNQILNAKNHEKEGEIIAQAGKLKAVTVATNMAGRGVDIILGGNPPDKEEAEKVKELGGLYVLGTERHEARRIDNQLRGRAGRQGDPGSTQFFVSLEDSLMRIFGGDRLKSLMNRLKIPEDQPIEAKLVSGAIESAQGKIEGMNFDARKTVLDYDDVMNKHREVIYKKRDGILNASKEELKEKILEVAKNQEFSEDELNKKEEEIGEDNIDRVIRMIFLRNIDYFWTEHLSAMDGVRDAVKLRAYGQQDPLVEYKTESHRMFRELIQTIESSVIKSFFNVQFKNRPSEIRREPSNFSSTASFIYEGGKSGQVEKKVGKSEKKINRNDPCPCGKVDSDTGKPIKYKKCCWPKYGR